jgi:carbon monoxide dehydrogenase subunit G
MKYSTELIIDLPRDKVVELFNNEENLFKWLKGLESFDHISGTKGEEGAVSKMVVKSGKREMEMKETIMKVNLPEGINFLYEGKGVQNWNDHTFVNEGDSQTKWTQNNVFKMKGAMKIFGFLMPGMFKKQTAKHMNDFKEFAEKEGKA